MKRGIQVLLSGILGLLFTTQLWSEPWASAYYAGWMQGWANNGHLPAQDIDYSAVTHIIHFSLGANADGTLRPDDNSITLTNSAELVSRAHAAGKKVIISVGGWNTAGWFRQVTGPAIRPVFIVNLLAFIRTRGYDGIDIDWEQLAASDATQYASFITALRSALDAVQPRLLLTAAVASSPQVVAQVAQLFDQINIMTYDLSGAWQGWVTWHNAPINDGGFQFPSTGNPVPSTDGIVNSFLQSGIPASKIGIGIDFYGYIWSGGSGTPTGGATAPRQGWSSAPSVQANVPYYTIMQDYYQSSRYFWDDAAQASYLSIDNPGSADDKFISFDDQTTVQKKFDYVRSKGIGGVIVWELGGGHRPELPAGQRDPLLQAVKAAVNGGVSAVDEEIPMEYDLAQNYPNPFNPVTTIEYSVGGVSGRGSSVRLGVYDMLGREVALLVNESEDPGRYRVQFDGSHLPSGVYFYRLTAEGFDRTRKLMLTK